MSGSDPKTTTKSGVLKDVEGALKDSIGGARKLFNSGNLYQPYQGSTVVPYSQATTDANQSILNGVPGASQQLGQSFNGIAAMGQDPYNGVQKDALATTGGIASGRNGITTGSMFAKVANGALDGTTKAGYDQLGADANGSFAQTNLADYASGARMGAANPAFDAVLKRSQADATNAVGLGASAAGRYGSGIAQGNVAREVGDLTNRALASRLGQDEANMFSANSMLDQQRLSNLGVRSGALAGRAGVEAQDASTRLAGASGLTNVQGQNIANQLGAAGDLFTGGQVGQQNRFTAANALPSLYDASLDPFRAQLGVGQMQEDYTGRQMQEALSKYNEREGLNRRAVEWLSAMATGAGNLGGTNTITTSPPKQSPFLGAAAGALSGYNKAAAGSGLGGALIGGGFGALSTIF